MKDYPAPKSLKEVRQFLGIASYYRRFIQGFAKIAQPLHALTQKGAVFLWTDACQEAFDRLKDSLLGAPILAYPDFQKNFVLETDANGKGLGAVLSQLQEDKRLHPVAYASRALSPQEKKCCRPLSCLLVWTRGGCLHRPFCSKSSVGNSEPKWKACSVVKQGVWQWHLKAGNYLSSRKGKRQC